VSEDGSSNQRVEHSEEIQYGGLGTGLDQKKHKCATEKTIGRSEKVSEETEAPGRAQKKFGTDAREKVESKRRKFSD